MSLTKQTTEPGEHGTHLPEKLRHLGDAVLHPHMPESLKHLGHNVSEMGHHMSESILHPPTTRCHACHAELAPEDIAVGCCSDKEACGCRAFSARCF